MSIKKIINATIIEKPTHSIVYSRNESLGNDGFFDLDDIDDYIDSDDDKPFFVFDCDEDKWKGINIQSVLEDAMEDFYEGARDQINDIEELEKFIDEWNAKQNVCQYYPNFNRIIVLDKQRFEDYITQYKGLIS